MLEPELECSWSYCKKRPQHTVALKMLIFFLSHVIFLEYVDVLLDYFLCDTVCLFICSVTFFLILGNSGFTFYSVFFYVGFYILSSSTVLMLRILPVFNIFNFPWIFFTFFSIFIVFLFHLLFYLSSIVFISYCYFFFVPCIFGLLFSFISNYFQTSYLNFSGSDLHCFFYVL